MQPTAALRTLPRTLPPSNRMSSSNNKRDSTSASNCTSAKRLRQLTLPWAPKPRTGTSSKYFSNTNASSESSSSSTPLRNASSKDTSSKEASRDHSSKDAFSTPKSQSQASSGSSSAPTPQRLQVPAWSRPQRKFDSKRDAKKHENARHNMDRIQVAKETLALIPSILDTTAATQDSILYLSTPPNSLYHPTPPPHALLPRLDPTTCPSLPKTKIRVEDIDSFACALSLLTTPSDVAVLNMANAFHQGGGWLEGSQAQEEQLCYRSTLIRTLNTIFYPFPAEDATIFSPSVAIFRTSSPDYTPYSDLQPPRTPEIVSVISSAAISGPELNKAGDDYKHRSDAEVTKQKIRMVLRVAAKEGKRKLVLGALGCGAFSNPNRRVAELFRDVFGEKEFLGGWWEAVVFAVLEDRRGNYEVFRGVLEGIEV